MRGFFPLIVAGAGVLVVGCTSPVQTSNGYTVTSAAPPQELAQAKGCKFVVSEISDLRRDPSVIGMLGPRVIRGPDDPSQWIHNVLEGLRSYGFDVSFRSAEISHVLTASVAIENVWVSSMATAKTGNVTLLVRYARDEIPFKEVHYRGAESEVNWFNSSDEIQGMIDEALAQILEAMSHDLGDLCSEAPS